MEEIAEDLSARWDPLARGVGLAPDEPVLVALSGGADSVFLLHLAAAASRAVAVHVDHGLRGAESDADAAFCAELARSLALPFRRVAVRLDAHEPDLEARARRARYRALCAEAHRLGIATIVTGHHADDSVETLLQRWTRGSSLFGLAGPHPRLSLEPGSDLNPTAGRVTVARPLLRLRRSEIRRELVARALAWREDGSNADPRFTRNRIRHGLLPAVTERCGGEAVEHLLAFGRAVARLEDALAERTAHLAWSRDARTPTGGGSLARAGLAALPSALRRRALVRLLAEGTGCTPGARLQELVLADLAAARCTRHALPGGWTLVLRSSEVLLLAPERPDPGPSARRLPVPGSVVLGDGRRLSAELADAPPERPAPRGATLVELDARGLPDELVVRPPRPGERFHGLGAPGSRRLVRLLADAGVPREERARVPLVAAGDEVLWVAGVRPAEARRVRADTLRRLRLALHEDADG